MANAIENYTSEDANIWSAADKGDTDKVKELLEKGRDANGRNCLGCTPLLYACGSGHLDTVKLLLDQPYCADVNRWNNDRLTSFMLAMQGGPLIGHVDSSWSGWDSSTTHDKLRRLMDLPGTEDLEHSRHDRWTALMEACNFGHKPIVEYLLTLPNIDLEAMNIRGQKAEDVANSRGHEQLVLMIQSQRRTREQPEEMNQIRELEEQVETLKAETRNRLLKNIDKKYAELSNLRSLHEREIETMTNKIDTLQEKLEEAMKTRLSMITRQVRIVKNAEEEIRQLKRKLENFDRYASSGNIQNVSFNSVAISPMSVMPSCTHSMGSLIDTGSASNLASGGNGGNSALFDKDFECSICLEEMKPPVKIFQCKNGHVMCEACKNHPEVMTCPICRIPLEGTSSLMRNIPMEKLARSYFEKMEQVCSRNRSRSTENGSRRASLDQHNRAGSQPPTERFVNQRDWC